MTMPTSFPRHFREVRFPFEFAELYRAPRRWFDGTTMNGGAASSYGNPFGGESVNSLWHENKEIRADFMAMAGVRENQRKDAQMISGQRNHNIHDILKSGAKKHGTNMMPSTTIEGAHVLAGSGAVGGCNDCGKHDDMRGGVMRTQAGAQYIRKRLTARIAELDTTDAGVNGVGAENPNDVGEPTEDDETLMNLGEYLDYIIEAVSTGNIDSSGVGHARAFLKNLLAGGWQIPSNQLVNLQRNLDETVRELTASISNRAPTYALSSDRKKVVRTMLTTLERARSAVEQLVKNSYLSPKERKMVLDNYKPQLKKQLAAQLESQVPGRLRGVPRDGEPDDADFVNDGAFQRTYAVPPRPSWYVNLQAIPGKIRLPRAVAEKIAAR